MNNYAEDFHAHHPYTPPVIRITWKMRLQMFWNRFLCMQIGHDAVYYTRKNYWKCRRCPDDGPIHEENS